MSAKAVVVFSPSGQPLPNVEVSFCLGSGTERKFELTNQDGYTLLQDFPPASGYIKVIANGFKSYLQLVSLDNQNQTIRVGNPATAPNDVVLPGLSFSKPSRDSIVNVKANFCNVTDAQGIPIFEDYIDYLILYDKNRANDWISRLKDAGSTHITLGFSGDYTENLGWIDRYPIPTIEWSVKGLSGYNQILDYVLNAGLIPFQKLSMDAFDYDPGGNGVGLNWGMKFYPELLSSLSDYFNECLWSTGWDGCFPVWSPEQTLAAIRMMRSVLGEQACIDTEFGGPPTVGYIHMGNELSDWAPDKLGDLDTFSLELTSYPPDENRIQECASRLLGPAATNIDPVNQGPFILNGVKTKPIFYETCAYQYIRKQINDVDVKAVNAVGKKYGFSLFGNGLP